LDKQKFRQWNAERVGRQAVFERNFVAHFKVADKDIRFHFGLFMKIYWRIAVEDVELFIGT
jgi:hypothetical protein